VDENVSEAVLLQAFDVIFTEIYKYIEASNSFSGIDWNTFLYVQKNSNIGAANADGSPGWFEAMKVTNQYGGSLGENFNDMAKLEEAFKSFNRPPMMKEIKICHNNDYIFGMEVIYHGVPNSNEAAFKVGAHRGSDTTSQ
jgi:hypothetical protein